MTTSSTHALQAPAGPHASRLTTARRSARKYAADDPVRVGLGRILFAILSLAAWEAASRWLIDPFWVGQPSLVAKRLWTLIESGDIWWHAAPTVGQAAAGLLLSLVVGIPIGLLFTYNRYVERVLEPFSWASTVFRVSRWHLFLFSGSASARHPKW